jgi:hypothetical protein
MGLHPGGWGDILREEGDEILRFAQDDRQFFHKL